VGLTVMTLKAFTMPKWGIEMVEGTVAEWMVREGEPFARGTVLALIETDKITNEVEAEADGCFVRLTARQGDTLPVGALLAVLGKPGTPATEVNAFVASFRPVDASMPGAEHAADTQLSPPPSAPAELAAPSPAPAIPEGIAISPVARAAAKAVGFDVEPLTGSGRKGRITAQDVDLALLEHRSSALKGPIDLPGQEAAFASPLARRLAVMHDIDLSRVDGTGMRGRIRKDDVVALVGPPVPKPAAFAPISTAGPGSVDVQPMSAIRRTIATRLTEAKQTIPHFYLRRRVRMDRLLALRAAQGKPGSINDYIVRATALALRIVPECNIQVHGADIHRFASADIALAVATSRGLMTPILVRADALDVPAIAKASAQLAERARDGKMAPHEYQGGSFTISNLGMFGVDQFDAIINPPQGAILAVGAVRTEPIVDNGALRMLDMVHLSMSCDHRAIDGADGARFLDALARIIEAADQL